MAVIWSYGVMACPARKSDLLVRTLNSLNKAGFSYPVIFLDDAPHIPSYFQCCSVVRRNLSLGAFGNFVLGMWELYLRNPNADRYIMFQDDVVCYKNLRQYLEACNLLSLAYYNLYTWDVNIKRNMPGWSLSDQMSRGALALMFGNQALRDLLACQSFIDHRKNCHNGHKAIDKAILNSLIREKGYREFTHTPSLVQHTGFYSTIKNQSGHVSEVFNGEDFDAMSLLELKQNA